MYSRYATSAPVVSVAASTRPAPTTSTAAAATDDSSCTNGKYTEISHWPRIRARR